MVEVSVSSFHFKYRRSNILVSSGFCSDSQQLKMTSQRAEDASEVFQLLEKYCSKRSKQRSPEMAVRTIAARRVKGNVPGWFEL